MGVDLSLAMSSQKPVANPQPITEHYEWSTKQKIGAGQFGEVFSVKAAVGGQFAIKELKCAKNKYDKTMREVETMANAKQKGIIELHEFFYEEGRSTFTLYLVQDLCRGGTLLAYLMGNPPPVVTDQNAKDIFAHIMFAMDYLHNDLKIAHRDLKPDNLMMQTPNEPMTTKIGDFGFAKQFDGAGANTSTQLGTYGYVSPEVMNPNKLAYDAYMADMFALGVILYEILSKRPPWQLGVNAEPARWVRKAEKDKFPEKWFKDRAGGTELISRLLVIDPKGRLTAKQVLHHEWMTGAVGVDDWRVTNGLSEADKAVVDATPVASGAARSPSGSGSLQRQNNNNQKPKAQDGGGCCMVQ